jgi:hypothetical protein
MLELDFPKRRELVREKIIAGKLPNTTKVVEDIGTRNVKKRPCSVCGVWIEPEDCQYVIKASGAMSDRQQYPGLCFLCHAAWQCEVGGVPVVISSASTP